MKWRNSRPEVHRYGSQPLWAYSILLTRELHSRSHQEYRHVFCIALLIDGSVAVSPTDACRQSQYLHLAGPLNRRFVLYRAQEFVARASLRNCSRRSHPTTKKGHQWLVSTSARRMLCRAKNNRTVIIPRQARSPVSTEPNMHRTASPEAGPHQHRCKHYPALPASPQPLLRRTRST